MINSNRPEQSKNDRRFLNGSDIIKDTFTMKSLILAQDER